MNTKPLIELSAIAGKIAIDQTKLHPIVKSSIKWSIDQVAKLLEEVCASDIEKIRNAAECYNINKVIAIPFPAPNGQHIVFVRAYDGNPAAFFNRLGMQIIPENTANDNLSFILELEKKIGVVIYERHNK